MNRRDFLKLILGGIAGVACLPYSLGAQSLPPNVFIPAESLWQSYVPLNDEQFGLMAIGDLGTGWSTQHKLLKLMAQRPSRIYQGILLLGDIVYPSAKPELFQKTIIEPYQPLFREGYKLYPLVGNHDWAYKKAIHLKQLFQIPDFYSFRLGDMVEVWMLNSNDDGRLFDRQQARWLELGLQRSNATWKIVSLHHPPYSSESIHGNNQHLIKYLSPMLERYGVDLCLSGHSHLYERTKSIRGVTYIVSGGGSASLRKYTDNNWFTEVIYSKHHFLDILGDSKTLSLRAIDADGQVLDSHNIVKSRSYTVR